MAATIGYVNVIKRSGKEGSRFPVTEDCLIGSGLHCEIRIHLADVAVEHCLIQCQEGGKCSLKNLCKQMPTKLNGTDVTEVAILHHGDTISVSDRLFRWEYEELPQISSVMKPTVALLPRNVTDDMGSSKRLVAVVSPQIRERQETSQSLRTWVLRRSVGNSLSSRTRHPAKTVEGRRSTSLVKFGPQDSDQSAVSDDKTPRLVNVTRRTSVTSSVKKSLLKVTPHVRKSGGASTVQPIPFETPHTVTSVMSGSVSDLVETPVSKTSRVKRSSISYSVTPRSRKSVQMGRLSHSVPSLKKTPNAEETVAVSSPRRSYRKDPLGVSSSVKSANATPDGKLFGGETPGVSQVKIGAQDSYQPAVLDSKTPHSVNVSRRTSIKSSVKKSLLKVTPNPRKSGGAEPIACETPHTFNSDMRDSVSDSVETPVSKTSRVKKSSISYSVTPRSRKSVQIGRLSHSVPSLEKAPTAEETVAVSSPRKSYRKDTLGESSSVKYANATPGGMFIGGETPDFSQVQSLGKRSQRYSQKVPAADNSATIVQSPDLFLSDQMPSNGEVAQLKELQKSSASAVAERPKRKSAGLLLAHIRESQELFSRSRRNSTPSANTDKINTRSARASMIVPKKSKLSSTPISQSKTPRKLKSLRAMSAKAAKRRLTDVDLSEIAANKLKAKSPKTPDKKKMAALLQCHKPRMLFSEVVKKTPVKKNIVAKLPSVPISRRRKVPKKPKVHTPRKASVKGINSTGHVDSPETIIIHGKQSMALKRTIQKIKEESESQKITATAPKFEDTKDVETSVSVKESSREMNTRKSVSFSPAPQVVAFAASRRISTRKSMKIPNITEENCGMLSPNDSNLLETLPNRKTSILKKSSSVETRTELMEIDDNSSAVTNLERVRNSSVVSSTPVRVSERQKGRTPSQSPSTPKMKVRMGKSSKCVSVTNQSPEALNTSIVSQASSTFDFDAVTTPCISVEKLVSPLNTTSSKKQINSDSAKRNVNISAQKIFKDLVADKVIDTSKWHYHDTNAATSATDACNWTGSEPLAMSSSRKSDRRSVSFPVNRYSTRKSQGKRSSEEVYASSNTTASELNQHDVASPSKKRKVSVNTQEESFISKDAGGFLVNKLEQLPGVAVASSPKLDRNSGRVHRISQQPVIVDSNDIEDAKKDLRSSKKSLPDALLSKGYVKQQSPSVRQRKSTINDLRDVTGVTRLFDTTKKQGSPANDLTDVRGVKQLLKTPKQQKLPKNDLTDVRGVKQVLKTPRTQKSPRNDLTDVRGVKRLLRSPLHRQKSPQNDLTDVRGVKKLFRSSKKQMSPKNDLTDVRGVKKLLQSPRQQKSPRNDLTDVRGVKKLLQSPRQQKSPQNDLTDVRGVKKLLQSPRRQKSPQNDLTDVRGVKKLLQSPRQQKSPQNDLTDVRGVKKLLQSPRQQKSPQNDLTDVRGVKKLLQSPRQQKSPRNDLADVRGVKRLLQSPRQQKSPQNDLTDVRGVKRLLQSPRQQKSPQNDLTDVRGVKRLLQSPRQQKSPQNDLTGMEGVKRLLQSPRQQKSVQNDLTYAGDVKGLVEPESHKNTNPPRTRRGKVQVSGGDTMVSDEKQQKSETANNLEQRDLLIMSSAGHTSPNVTNVPQTRRTRKQAVAKEMINSNLQASAESTSLPRTHRGKKVTVTVSKSSEEVKSQSVVETDISVEVCEQNDLFVHPTKLASLDTASSPRTRRGRKQIMNNKKVGEELEQFRDVLQKHEEDVLIKTSQLVSTVAVSPLKTRRGKKYIEKSKEQDEDLKSVSHSSKLKPEVETHKLTQNQQEMQSVNDGETASLKIRGGNRGDVSKQQRKKAVTSLSGNNSAESRESDTLSPKPQQKRVIFADVLHASSPSNSPSSRTRRAKKQVVNEESEKKGGLKAGDQLLSDECDKPVGKRHQRKLVNADSVEYSPSTISGQSRTRKGRKFHTATVSEELKLPFKTPSPRDYKTDGTTAIAESEQSKVSDSVFIDSNTISPLKPRRGRKAGTVTVSSTAEMRERTEINRNLDKNIATSVAHTLDTGLADNSTCEVPVVASSKRTLRGKKENVTRLAATTVPSSDKSETEERNSVKSTRAGRKRAVNLENGFSAVSIQIGSSKDTAIIDSPPPKRSRRVRIRGDMEEGKPSSRSELIELNSTQTETESTDDSIEKRLHGLTHKTRQATVCDASKIVDQPDEASEERTSSRRRGVRQHKKETNKNELGNGQSTDEAEQRSTRSKRKHVQETGERSPRKKKNTQSDRLLDVSSEPRVVSPRATRQRRNRRT
ncbi:proliferation marker protein Ki-67-like [Schistocerca serialis cubense]|uniref:proliferation marker protein Ki-67-like n=1 Tax=Schistocerca serialis cubense TaxID=2023355 RepID=UPI00214DF3A0|nr:proliferation marker protein Ki-67-like [Schistocerca serialis cubense]